MTPLTALFRRAAPDARPDGALLAAFVADRADPGFAELVRRHGPPVWAVCRRALPDHADAEDAFQTTFLVLVRRAGRLTGAGTVGPWLLRVAALTARNARRKAARRLARSAPLPADVPAPAAPPPLDPDVLRGLPDRCRAALLLCHVEGLTHREAAARLGCAEGTVASLVSRGRAMLRGRLADPAALAAAVPAALSAATVRAAVAAAVPAAGFTREVLRMIGMRKTAAAGFATVVLLAAGFAAGLAARHAPATGQEKTDVKRPTPPAAPADPKAAGPYLEFVVHGMGPAADSRNGVLEPYTITEYDAKGRCRWSVIPGRDQAARWAATPKLIDFDQDAVTGGAREYLTRVRKDATTPRDLRLVILDIDQVGGLSLEAITICHDAGFDTVRFTGYVPHGGFIPRLRPRPDGEAEGYTYHRGGPVETKKLLADYRTALRAL